MVNFIFTRLLFPLMFLASSLGMGFYTASGNNNFLFSSVNSANGIVDKVHQAEQVLANRVPMQRQFVDFYFRLQMLMGKTTFNDFTFVKAKDGELNYGSFIAPYDDEVWVAAKRCQAVYDQMHLLGNTFIVYNPPLRPVNGPSAYAAEGVPWRNLNPQTDAFMNHLRAYGVPSIDSRYGLTYASVPPEKTGSSG